MTLRMVEPCYCRAYLGAAAMGPQGGLWVMVIEWLQVTVPVADQARYLAADAKIWTAALAAQPGFLGKEVWVRADDPTAVNLIIRWNSRAAWKAVPGAVLAAVEAAFVAAMGQAYPVVACVDLDVV
jgi:uncharacterized protein (TIGR03792 family)